MNYNFIVQIVDSSEKYIWTYTAHNQRCRSIAEGIWEDSWSTEDVDERGLCYEILIV